MDILSLIPTFGNFAFTIIAFVVALSVIVAIHEYGHYIVGRWSGIHAEVFSLGFGPVVWSGHDKHGTKWQLAAFPLGGYVKFLGDSSAASGKDGEMISSLSDVELRRTMHGAPLWARFATVLAGPVFNFILAILVFAGLALWSGVASYPPAVKTIYQLPNADYGVQEGDVLLAIEGITFPEIGAEYQAFADALPLKPRPQYTIERDGQQMLVDGPPLSPTRVDYVSPGLSAEAAGIMMNDVILSVGGHDVYDFSQLIPLINETEGKPTAIGIWRDGAIVNVSINAKKLDLPRSDASFETRYIMGVSGSYFFEPAAQSTGFGEAIAIGVQSTWGVAKQSLSGLYHMAIGAISSCNISGPIGIAKVSGQMASQGFSSFIYFIAVLSAAVGLLNLFPIPVLDGGHLVFFTWEAIVGKPPSDKALQVFMGAGLVIVLSFMVFALTNDLFCP